MLEAKKNAASEPRSRYAKVYANVIIMSTPQRKKRPTVADRIREARERRVMKQVELALRSGLQPSAISQFESGQREPSPENLCKLADGLGVTIDFLLGRDQPAPAGPQLLALFRHAQGMTQNQLDQLERFATFLADQHVQKERPRKSENDA